MSFSRLEEDGKVLSPEELLYRCVLFVNHTHDKVPSCRYSRYHGTMQYCTMLYLLYCTMLYCIMLCCTMM